MRFWSRAASRPTSRSERDSTARSRTSSGRNCRCCRCGTRTTSRACGPMSTASSCTLRATITPSPRYPWSHRAPRSRFDVKSRRKRLARAVLSRGGAAMIAFIVRRLLLMIPTVFGLITLVFFFLSIVPGDPVDAMLGESAPAADREALREKLGLNQPVLKRYGQYVSRLVQGDLGESINYARGTSVFKLIAERFPNTALLAICAVGLALVI